MSGEDGARTVGDMRTAVCAIAGLACMFAGIWLADGQLLGANASEEGTLSMRVCTCVVYLVFYLAARRFLKRGDCDVRWFFGVSTVVGFLFFVGGASLSLFVMPVLERGSFAWSAAGLCSLAMIKTIGAPLSMGFVCLFARIGSATVMRACTLGMLGAFALYSLASQNPAAAVLGAFGSVALAAAALGAALLLAMIGFGGTPVRGASGRLALAPSPLSVPGVVKRPHAKVVTPGFVIMLVFSAMMLGFLRNGFTGGDYHNDPMSFLALIALFAVALAWRGLRIEHVFYGALLCTAVGVLLARPLAWALPGAEQMLCGLGTTLFEVVSWALVVWAARNSIETLRAAAGMRLAATVGHLLGTIVVAVGMVLSAGPSDALFASEQLMVFIYMVLLVVLLKFPGLQAPFATASDASEYAVADAGAEEAAALGERAGASGGVRGEGRVFGSVAGDAGETVGGVVPDSAGAASAGFVAGDGRAAVAAGGEFPGEAALGRGGVAGEGSSAAFGVRGDGFVSAANGGCSSGGGGVEGSSPNASAGVSPGGAASGVPVPLMPGASVGGAGVGGGVPGAGVASGSVGAGVPGVPSAPLDPVSVPCDTIARTYRLTAREREVLGLIAHGRNMPFMEQELVISRNTLKMHIRHIYTKLDVHSKQEIIDMVEALIAS